MPTTTLNARAPIVPALRDRHPDGSHRLAVQAFGFERHAVATGKDGRVAHAELAFGNGMIMLGPLSENDYGRLIKQPSEAGGETQAPYVIVADAALTATVDHSPEADAPTTAIARGVRAKSGDGPAGRARFLMPLHKGPADPCSAIAWRGYAASNRR